MTEETKETLEKIAQLQSQIALLKQTLPRIYVLFLMREENNPHGTGHRLTTYSKAEAMAWVKERFDVVYWGKDDDYEIAFCDKAEFTLREQLGRIAIFNPMDDQPYYERREMELAQKGKS